MLTQIGRAAKAAAATLATTSGAVRRAALRAMSEALAAQQTRILAANEQDLAVAQQNQMRSSLQDRLRLTPERLGQMQEALLQLATEPDPLGLVLGGGTRPNGLQVQQVSVPLGVIGMIYEARPNVTADAAGLCVASGNAVVLRGGKEAIHSNTAIANALRAALALVGLPQDAVQLLADTSRASATALMHAVGVLDVLIPRGGAGLIQAVLQEARVPVIETGAGVCHTYVDASAQLPMALAIIENAKCHRPSVCNALETLLVHQDIAPTLLPALAQKLARYPVELRGDAATLAFLPLATPVTESDWQTEYGDLTLSVRVVPDMAAALAHIAQYSTRHSECIVTEDYSAAERFVQQVDAAAVYVNASTRFTDGGEFGFGAEIGIATQKLHARGPLGLRHLTSYKYIVRGSGQIRG